MPIKIRKHKSTTTKGFILFGKALIKDAYTTNPSFNRAQNHDIMKKALNHYTDMIRKPYVFTMKSPLEPQFYA